MAKKVFGSELAVNEDESVMQIEENNEEVNTTDNVKEVESSDSEKMVKITTLCKVDCVIGNKAYKFDEGKQATVPMSVACILANSRKAYRI